MFQKRDKFEQIWPNLDKFEPLLTSLNQFEQVIVEWRLFKNLIFKSEFFRQNSVFQKVQLLKTETKKCFCQENSYYTGWAKIMRLFSTPKTSPELVRHAIVDDNIDSNNQCVAYSNFYFNSEKKFTILFFLVSSG